MNDGTEVLMRYLAITTVVVAVILSAGGIQIRRERNEKGSALASMPFHEENLTQACFITGSACQRRHWQENGGAKFAAASFSACHAGNIS